MLVVIVVANNFVVFVVVVVVISNINYYVDMTVPIESIRGLILMIMQYRHNTIFTRVTK